MVEPLAGAIALPDGTLIRGRGRREPMPAGPLPDVVLYLGRPPEQQRRSLFGYRVTRQPEWAVCWIDWPDFRIPRNGQLAVDTIRHAFLLARAGLRVEVACRGGTGRTGTVIACMAVLAGHPPADALTWTRRHYRPRAIETPGQRRWISWFADHTRARAVTPFRSRGRWFTDTRTGRVITARAADPTLQTVAARW